MKPRRLTYPLVAAAALALACAGAANTEGAVRFLEVVETAPGDGQQGVPVEGRIAVRISEQIDPATLTQETLFLTDEEGSLVPGSVKILEEPDADPSAAGTAAELNPDSPLEVITNYAVTVTTGLMSFAGNSLEDDFEWRFTTLDSEWGESEWIEPLGAWNSTSHQIAVDPQRNAIAVWQLNDGAANSILANRYTRIELWGEAQRIDDGNGGATNPKLAIDGAGNGFAVWERRDAGSSDQKIWSNRYDVETARWGTATLLQNGEVTRARLPAIAANLDGNATAVWVQDDLDTGREVVRAIRYEPNGGWGAAVTIGVPDTFLAAGRTAVGMDDTGAAVAIWDPAGVEGKVLWASRYIPSSGSWDAAAPIAGPGANVFRLDVGANGDAFVVWIQSDGDAQTPRNDVWSARFSEGVWGNPERIDQYDAGNKKDPDITVNATGRAYAVWSQEDSDFSNIWAAQFTPGSGWGAPGLIESPTQDPSEDDDATTPQVDVNRAGNVFVVWSQRWDGWGSVWSNRLDPDGSWMIAKPIEDIAETATQPIIAVDDARHAHALWLHGNRTGRKVRTNRFE